MTNGYPLVKRAMDIAGAAAGLTALAPLAPFVALAIKLDSRGPVFVALDRVSEGKMFKLYKFRSMVRNAGELKAGLRGLNERDGPFFKIRNDPRLTSVGKIIRKFRLDEFPQLWNVLRGELSLVGPRPHEPGELASYPPPYRHLALARAGVTGLSQVNGASSLPFLKELELDSRYIERQGFWLDCRIIAKTVAVLFFDPTAV